MSLGWSPPSSSEETAATTVTVKTVTEPQGTGHREAKGLPEAPTSAWLQSGISPQATPLTVSVRPESSVFCLPTHSECESRQPDCLSLFHL